MSYSSRIVKGKNNFIVEFRHPLLQDSKGNYGRKVRKGVGLDEHQANQVNKDLNHLLNSEDLWVESIDSIVKRGIDSKAVDIFFSNILSEQVIKEKLNKLIIEAEKSNISEKCIALLKEALINI